MTPSVWKCALCGYTIKREAPPEKCPSCEKTCEFLNVTCYTPDCASRQIDKRLK